MSEREVFVKDTHRALWYEDGVLTKVLGAGRYELPKESAISYGVAIGRADVKDLVFPGNLQEIMNLVLGAERVSEAQLVEARTKAEVQKIEAQAKADAQRLQALTDAEIALINAKSSADAAVLAVQAEMQALEERQKSAGAYGTHPALLRLEELKTLRELARNANARLYLDFKEKPKGNGVEE
jgi:regulator of protease activity HflC (stomatin/prohibitin superfamily)